MIAMPDWMVPIAPSPDKAAVLAALAVLFDPGDVIELRAFPKGRKRTDAGYFDADHWDALADHAARLSAGGAAVYITLNPVDPQLLSRYSNRVEAYAKSTTTDKQVTRRRWLLIDLDPVRPAGTSATDTQLEAARIKAREVCSYLVGIGWPAPVVAISGNGYHLLCAIDLPNDEASTALVKAVLLALGERFDDAHTKVDHSVFNAARICKLYGTVANKGDHTAAAPWRLSRLLETPARAVVSVGQLAMVQPPALAATTVAAPGTRPVSTAPTTRTAGSFNLEDFLARHGMVYTYGQHEDRERFKLAACPFNSEHVNGEAAVFRKPSGELGFKCQHDSCASKGWRMVRDLLDGPRKADLTPPLPLNVVFADDLPDTFTPPDELVQGVITAGDGSVWYGDSNSGKTFFIIDMACAVARGVDWMGRKTEPGLVVYLAAESPASVSRRLQAYQRHHEVRVPNFAIVQSPIDLFDGEADTNKVIQVVRQLEQQRGQKARLVVGDTLARLSAGANENAGQDMGLVVRRFDRIRAETGAHFALIHHSGKAAAAGARGWSGIRAAVDTEIEITDSPAGRCCEITKQRDLATKGDRIGFKLEGVTLGFTKWGATATSCVVVTADAPEKKTGKRMGEVEGAVIEFLAAHKIGIKKAKLAKHFNGRYERTNVYRAIKTLLTAQAIHEAAGMVCIAGAAK